MTLFDGDDGVAAGDEAPRPPDLATAEQVRLLEGVEYRDIPGYHGYRAGSDGTIWSQWGRVSLGYGGGSRTVLRDDWHCLTLNSYQQGGYRVVGLRVEGRMILRAIHTLVLLAFAGPCPEGMECCHNNGDCTDNRAENLRWDTRAENYADRRKHGNDPIGARNAHAKLTDDKVRAMRRRHDSGDSIASLAAEYGVHYGTAWVVVKRKGWAHVAD